MSHKVTNETYSRVDYVTKDGKHDWKKISENSLEEELEDLTSKHPQVETKFTQSFAVQGVGEISPLDDLAEIAPDPIRQAQIINNSLRIYQMKAITDIFENDNFTPVEGSYDLADVCATVAMRASASPEIKAARALSKIAGYEITPEALASILAAMNPAGAAA
jgi:hypothetical protein